MTSMKMYHTMVEPDRLVLNQCFDGLVDAAAKTFGVPPAHVKAPGKHKTRAVVKARESVVQSLIALVSYKDCIARQVNGVRARVRYVKVGRSDQGGGGWHRISTPMMGRLFHCDHSTVVLLMSRLRRRAMRACKAAYIDQAAVVS